MQRKIQYFTTTLILFFYFFSLTDVHAQFGISFKYVLDYEDIPSNIPGKANDRLSQQGSQVALDYRIKLVNYGVLFGPEIFAKMVRIKGIDIFDASNLEVGRVKSIRSFGMNIPVTIYPFHFDQCDECPTFSRQHFFKNHFFLQPVVGYELRNWVNEPDNVVPEINEHFAMAGLGLGLDFFAGKYVKISPILQYKHYFPLTDNSLYQSKLKPAAFEAGVRIGWGR